MAELISTTPEGYKETELGLLPEEWEVVRLGDLTTVKYGKARPKEPGDIPAVGSGGIYGWTSEPLIDFPTLIVGRKGTAGKVWLQEGPCWPSDTTFYVEWKSGAVDHRYAYHCLQQRPLSGEHAKTTLPSLSKPDLENYLLPLPPLPEQRAIAHVLRTVQKAKEATGQVIASTRELKRSVMRHLFTYGPAPVDGADQVPLKETGIGPVPEHWEVVKLGDVIECGAGSIQTGPFGSLLHASDYVPHGTPFVMPKDLREDGRIVHHGDARVSSEDLQRLSRYRLETGDLLVARRGEIGRRGLVTDKEGGWVCGTGCLRVRPGKLLHPSFLSQILGMRFARDWLEGHAVGTTMLNLNTQILDALPIPFPPMADQEAIADMVASVDTKISAEENRRESLDVLFKTLLHNLMTGKLRVEVEAGG